MNFITKNYKQAGIFNTLLIAAGIIYDIVRVFSASNVFFVVTIVLQ